MGTGRIQRLHYLEKANIFPNPDQRRVDTATASLGIKWTLELGSNNELLGVCQRWLVNLLSNGSSEVDTAG